MRVVKTPHGYVGKSYTIARLDLLTLDLAISPMGDLYVCCHSGPPDWGTGPQGEGKIFKISYTDPKAPQPVAVWPASATEVRIAFDRPLDPSVTNAFNVGQAASLPGAEAGATNRSDQQPASRAGWQPALPSIEFGEYVSAGDRFEVLKPPYAVVEQQDATPRGKLAVRGARLDQAQDAIVLSTDPHSLAVNYSIGGLVLDLRGNRDGRIVTVDLEYDFSGAQIERMDYAKRAETYWLPHPVGLVAYALTRESKLKALVDFDGGATVLMTVFKPPAESWQLATPDGDRRLDFAWQLEPVGKAVFVKGSIGRVFDSFPLPYLTAKRTHDDHRFAPPIAWFQLPWAPTNRASVGTDSRPVPKPQGDWEHGRDLFTGTTLNCAKCHRIRGEGGLAGPDLSNLIHRDARSVERDIREPSATLHPDYVTYLAELKNGDTHNGFIRSQSRTGSLPVPDRGASSPRSPGDPNAAEPGRLAARPTLEDSVVLFDADGKDTVIPRADLANLHPTGQSRMPTGLLDTLKPDDVRDLLTFLLWEPPVRTRAETDRALAASSPSPLGGERAGGNPTAGSKTPSPLPALSPPGGSGEGKPKALRVVLVASKQDHGPGQHDYPRWQEKWLRLLPLAATNAVVEKAWEWPGADQFATADVLVFYFWNHDWSPARYAQFDAYQQRGGGAVILHSACIADREPEKLAERIGLSATPGTVSYRHMPFDLTFTARDHPLVRGLPETLHFLDEPYWPLIGDPSRVTVLAHGQVDGAPKPPVWTFERDGSVGRKGRVFGSILGHYFWTLDDPLYRLLVLRAIAWAGGADVNRLADAALLEAAVK